MTERHEKQAHALLLLLTALLSACGDKADALPDGGAEATSDAGADGSDGNDPPPLEPPRDAVALRVDVARGFVQGSTRLELVVTIANGERAKPAPIDAAKFIVNNQSGWPLENTLSATEWVTAELCDSLQVISPGQTVTCALAARAQMGFGDWGEVLYVGQPVLDPESIPRATFELEPCTECPGIMGGEPTCSYLDVDETNCGACGRVVYGEGTTCRDGTITCEGALPERCLVPWTDVPEYLFCSDLNTANNCGACGAKVSDTLRDGVCIDGEPGCQDGVACAGVCREKADCTCGVTCGAGYVCTELSYARSACARAERVERGDDSFDRLSTCGELCTQRASGTCIDGGNEAIYDCTGSDEPYVTAYACDMSVLDEFLGEQYCKLMSATCLCGEP